MQGAQSPTGAEDDGSSEAADEDEKGDAAAKTSQGAEAGAGSAPAEGEEGAQPQEPAPLRPVPENRQRQIRVAVPDYRTFWLGMPLYPVLV